MPRRRNSPSRRLSEIFTAEFVQSFGECLDKLYESAKKYNSLKVGVKVKVNDLTGVWIIKDIEKSFLGNQIYVITNGNQCMRTFFYDLTIYDENASLIDFIKLVGGLNEV